MAHKKTWILVATSLLTLLLIGCGAAPTPETVVVKETVVAKETVVVKETIVVKETVVVEHEVTRVAAVEKEIIVTATPEPPTPSPVPRMILQDDFGDPGSGWVLESSDEFEGSFEEGRLHLQVKAPRLLVWIQNPELQSLDDFDLEVDATQVSGPDNNEFGVMFRFQNPDNFYAFLITGEGRFGLIAKINGEYYNIINFTLAPSVQPGMSTNRLRLVADGPQLSVYANGDLLAIVPDNTFRRGDIFLAAGAFEEGGVHIAFDNIKVTELE